MRAVASDSTTMPINPTNSTMFDVPRTEPAFVHPKVAATIAIARSTRARTTVPRTVITPAGFVTVAAPNGVACPAKVCSLSICLDIGGRSSSGRVGRSLKPTVRVAEAGSVAVRGEVLVVLRGAPVAAPLQPTAANARHVGSPCAIIPLRIGDRST